jgi:DNA-binding beta-propeller fold protein YncE
VAITPDGRTAYVTDLTSSTVVPIGIAAGARGTPIAVQGPPQAIAITPDGRTAFVTADALGSDSQASGTLISIALATGTASAPVSFPDDIGSGGAGYVAVVPATALVRTGPIVSGDRTGKCAEGRDDSAANDTPVVISDCDGSPGQNWTVQPDGTIQLNGKCLDVYRQEKTSKARVELWTCTGHANQQWQPSDGTLINPASGKCLDDPGYRTASGTQLDIYACNGGLNQQWKVP